jgi:GNAT superfamily N-acetyltransferase
MTMVELPGQETLIECWAALARTSPGASVVRTPSTVAAVFPAWLPLNNAIVVDPGDGDGDAHGHAHTDAEAEVRALFAGAGVDEWALWLASATSGFGGHDAVRALGALTRADTTVVMTKPLSGGEGVNPAVVVTSIATVGSFDDDPIALDDAGAPDAAGGLTAWAYVHDGVIVSCAYTYLHGTDCGVYGVGTAPAWRRHGFARALVDHALADAHAHGATTASLQSTEMGAPLYRSMGFVAAGRYEEWSSARPVTAPAR